MGLPEGGDEGVDDGLMEGRGDTVGREERLGRSEIPPPVAIVGKVVCARH